MRSARARDADSRDSRADGLARREGKRETWRDRAAWLRPALNRCANGAVPSSMIGRHWSLALLAVSAAAQSRPWSRERVLASFADEQASVVAWAAHHAAEKPLPEYVPAAPAALRRLVENGTARSCWARMAILDMLLQLKVRLPAEELLPHGKKELVVPCLLIAAQCPEASTDYFARVFERQHHDLVWAACGDLLAAQRAPGFASRCLRDGPVQLDLDHSRGVRCRMVDPQLPWSDAMTRVDAVVAERAASRSKFAAMVAGLRSNGAMTTEESAAARLLFVPRE